MPLLAATDPLPSLRLPAPLPGGCVWLLDLRLEPDVDAWRTCQASEHARAARFKFELHARRYRAAHAGMRKVMAAHLGLAMRDWAWRAGEHGKPHCVVAQHGHFNLSHSEDWALLAWHPDVPLGVDIEWQQALPDHDRLATHCFTPAEQAWMDEVDAAPEREARFHRLWCAKEAALKALGSGLRVAPWRVEVALGRGGGNAHIDLGPADGRRAGARCRLTVTEVVLPAGLPARAALAAVARGDQSACW